MHPIVLVHGIANPNTLSWFIQRWNIPLLGSFETFQYFKGIAAHLEKNGFGKVLSPNLAFAAPSAERAKLLKIAVENHLQRTGAEKVHLIAHSMGGLDSRRMIVDLGMADKVASLTTIGTPHWGTLLADEAIEHGGDPLIVAAGKFFDLRGARDLRKDECKRMNEEFADAEAKNSVFYQTYSSHPTGKMLWGPFLFTYLFIQKPPHGQPGGENDALVPVDSQKWAAQVAAPDGTKKKDIVQKEFPFRADHLNEIGWWLKDPTHDGPDKVKAVYLEIAQSVRHL
jgi:triacylglycerol lipase